MSRVDQPMVWEPVKATPRRAMTKGRRARIIERQGHVCARCRDRVSVFEIDHVLPLELGGADTDDNLEALCGRCHRAKTNADAGRIAKARRLRKREAGETRPKRQILGRGFDRRLTKGFDGRVRERTETSA